MFHYSPGDKGIDFSGFRLTHPRAALRAGGKFVVRYTAGAATNPSHPSHASVSWKLVTPSEFKELVAAGNDIVANDEWYESRCTEGAAAGHEDAVAACFYWHACGLAKGASIYVSWDEAPVQGKWHLVADYLHAYQRVARKYGYHVDLYAGDPAIAHFKALGLIRFGWRPEADSWSGTERFYQTGNWKGVAKVSPSHVWQSGAYWFSNNADEDIVLKAPIGSHKEALAGVFDPKPAPAPKPQPTPPPAPKPTPAPDGHTISLALDGKVIYTRKI